MEADKDRDGKINFEEFTKMVENTDISMSMTLVCHTVGFILSNAAKLITGRINSKADNGMSFVDAARSRAG